MVETPWIVTGAGDVVTPLASWWTSESVPPGRNWTSGGSEQFSYSALVLNKA